MTYLIAASASEVFTYIGYIIVALIVLMLMIVIHELGHYGAGKMLGFKINEFGIGFGPCLFKRTNKKNGEVFSLRMLPLGGFCAFHGEDEDGKEDSLAFNNQKPWKRLIVLFSGAFLNFLTAIFIITIFFSAYGQVLPSVLAVNNFEGAGNAFQTGDTILSVNGKQVNIMEQKDLDTLFMDLGSSANFTVLRDGERVKINASKSHYNPFKDGHYIYSYNDNILEIPLKYEVFLNEYDHLDSINLVAVKYADDNLIDGVPINKDTVTSQSSMLIEKEANLENLDDGWYTYGFGITRTITRVKLPFFLAWGRSFSFCFFIVFKILASIGALLTGQIGLESAGGTLTVIGTIATISQMGFDSFLYVIAIISANLAVMNLLPIPALDGSRMVFTLIEMVFRRPVPRKIEAAIHFVGIILLILLAVFLDVFHLVNR